MQLGAINSVNFGKRSQAPFRSEGAPVYDADYTEIYEAEPSSKALAVRKPQFLQKPQLSYEERKEIFDNKVAQIQANVRPETCVLTAATIGLAIAKGKNIAHFVGKLGVYANGIVHTGLAKAGSAISGTAGKLVSKVFKKATFNEAEHAQKLADKLAKYSFNNLDKAAKNIGAPDTKFVKAVGKRVGVFVADNEKAKEATKFITEKMGINSKSSIPLSILAGVFGWKFGDGGGDILEAVLDNKQIEREYNKLFADNSAA